VLVQEEVAETFVEMLRDRLSKARVGDPRAEDTLYGPLQSARIRDQVLALVEDATGKGARLLTGGAHADGLVVRPVLLDEVTDDMLVSRDGLEEFFVTKQVSFRI
jgi:acyl-CoA reductase-like NAD-dependent aldehyde dehydrogenase